MSASQTRQGSGSLSFTTINELWLRFGIYIEKTQDLIDAIMAMIPHSACSEVPSPRQGGGGHRLRPRHRPAGGGLRREVWPPDSLEPVHRNPVRGAPGGRPQVQASAASGALDLSSGRDKEEEHDLSSTELWPR